MTQGLTRFQNSGDFHFVTFSCYGRQPYLGSSEARSLFERSLETMRLRYSFYVFGYVVMPEHVHLLISEPPNTLLSKAIQALKLSVAVQRKERPFWQARYYDFNVFTQHKQVEKLKYMHRNPVTRKLVAKPEDWPWSSFRHYSTGELGTVEVESWWTSTRRESASAETHISPLRCGTRFVRSTNPNLAYNYPPIVHNESEAAFRSPGFLMPIRSNHAPPDPTHPQKQQELRLADPQKTASKNAPKWRKNGTKCTWFYP
jgi:putative transposase